MFATIDVLGHAGRRMITIPSKAVLNEGDKSLVIIASEGTLFRARQVEVGPDIDGQVRVFKGLIPGEKIVSAGAIFMKREIETQ
jgi:cobalt-zinc-cadmium efflux system membrane fusion protein